MILYFLRPLYSVVMARLGSFFYIKKIIENNSEESIPEPGSGIGLDSKMSESNRWLHGAPAF